MKPKSENSRAPASGFSLFGACTVMENACQSLLIPEVLVTWQELRTSQQFWSQFQRAVNGSGRGYNPHFGGIGSLFHLVIRLVWKGKVSSKRELCIAARTLWRHSMCFLMTWVHMQVLENRARFARTVLAGVFRDAGCFHRITWESL